MARFNKRRQARPQAYSPIKSAGKSGITYEGAPGYIRTPGSELFLLAASNFMDADTFYESMNDRDNRLLVLTRQMTVQDPAWMLELVTWLRGPGNLRTVALVMGLEAAKHIMDVHPPLVLGSRSSQGLARLLAKAGIARADEPGEAMAYWFKHFGRRVPMPVKRAIADKATELYNQYTLLKYDTGSHGFRFADIIQLTHARPATPEQDKLFKYALDRRYGSDVDMGVPIDLFKVVNNVYLRHRAVEHPQVLLDPEQLRRSAMTWEDALSLAGSRIERKQLWEAMIPSMPYMAVLRNLRNFDQAGVSGQVAQQVIAKLTDPDQVARSRQLPFRFLTTFQNVPSLRWAWPLEQALNLSLANVPSLPGRTLILVDTSTSMNKLFSARGSTTLMQMAALFGIAFASRAERADVVSFSTYAKKFPVRAGESVLAAWGRFREGFFFGGGTNTAHALRAWFQGHDRVIIVTDEQAASDYRNGEVTACIPAHVPMHTINVMGYIRGMTPSGHSNRHVYGGMSDSMFRLIPLVEQGVSAQWPWQQEQG